MKENDILDKFEKIFGTRPVKVNSKLWRHKSGVLRLWVMREMVEESEEKWERDSETIKMSNEIRKQHFEHVKTIQKNNVLKRFKNFVSQLSDHEKGLLKEEGIELNI